MTTDAGIGAERLQTICAIFKHYPNIQEAILFGSRAKGNFRNGSDIDIALKGKDLGPRLLTQIGLDYEKLFLPWKLDVIVYDTIENAALREHINRVGVCLYRA